MGKYKSTVTCQNCQQDSVTYEDFMFLTLPVSDDLRKSFKLLTHRDDLDSDNMYKCDKCKSESTASKKLSISMLPEVLIIYLKRFTADRKIDDYMEIPLKFYDEDNNSYELVGVVNHFGSRSGGHYTANIQIGGRWYNMNDGSYNEIDKSHVITRNAYMLFFERQ